MISSSGRTFSKWLLWAGAALFSFPAFSEPVFPGDSWGTKNPNQLGLDPMALEEVSSTLGGRGCVIQDGWMVHSWGDISKVGDWKSSAKPVLSTLLFFAIHEGRVESVDQPIADFGWELSGKDGGVTFRHLGAMTSGYARPEGPGEAWAYNDYAINLYQKTLFDRVFEEDPKVAAEHPDRLGAVGLEDGLRFRESNRRLSASVRDFARIAWFWLNKGKWGGRDLLPANFFDEYMKPQVPENLPPTLEAGTDDYLEIGSYGGGSDHYTKYGPGIYGFNWWFNATGRLHPNSRTWPDAPPDAFMSIGAGGNCSLMIPSENFLLVCAEGNWGKLEGGKKDSPMNKLFLTISRVLGKD